MPNKILVLGGSTEGFMVAEQLDAHANFNVISSLAGRTSIPRKPRGSYRTGGFGGINGMIDYIKTNDINAIIDATHPFAIKMSQNANAAAKTTQCPIVHINRPPWQKTKEDNWIEVASMQAAANSLALHHSPVFLTIGRLELSAFLERDDITFFTRAIEPPKKSEQKNKPLDQESQEESWPKNFKFLYAKGPFTYENEAKLIKTYGIKAIVTKNSGGTAASAKLAVARDQNIPVIMIKRPPLPAGEIVSTAEEALRWLEKSF